MGVSARRADALAGGAGGAAVRVTARSLGGGASCPDGDRGDRGDRGDTPCGRVGFLTSAPRSPSQSPPHRWLPPAQAATRLAGQTRFSFRGNDEATPTRRG